MNRVSMNELYAVVSRINRATGNPEQPYRPALATDSTNGQPVCAVAQVGNYHLSGAYGGWALYQVTNEAGGCRDVFRVGHVPKRELLGLMRAFLAGLDAAKAGE